MKSLDLVMLWLKARLDEFTHDEKGDVNIVSIVVLIGIAVILAVAFKDKIVGLLKSIFDSAESNVQAANQTVVF